MPFDRMSIGQGPFGLAFVNLVSRGLGGVSKHVPCGIEDPALGRRPQSGKPVGVGCGGVGGEDIAAVEGDAVQTARSEILHGDSGLVALAFEGVHGQGQLSQAHHFIRPLE